MTVTHTCTHTHMYIHTRGLGSESLRVKIQIPIQLIRTIISLTNQYDLQTQRRIEENYGYI